MVRAAKKYHNQREERRLLYVSEQKPYLYLKRRQRGAVPNVNEQEVKEHFNRLFWNEEAIHRPPVHVELPLT